MHNIIASFIVIVCLNRIYMLRLECIPNRWNMRIVATMRGTSTGYKPIVCKCPPPRGEENRNCENALHRERKKTAIANMPYSRKKKNLQCITINNLNYSC